MRCKALIDKVMTAEEAAAFVAPNANVGMSGFTGAGYPKPVPAALVERIGAAKARGGPVHSQRLDRCFDRSRTRRCPRRCRRHRPAPAVHVGPGEPGQDNAGLLDYLDLHLSHVAQMVWEGFFGPLDFALVEVAGITEAGELIPSSSVGNNETCIDRAAK